jgi:hypothetical protein
MPATTVALGVSVISFLRILPPQNINTQARKTPGVNVWGTLAETLSGKGKSKQSPRDALYPEAAFKNLSRKLPNQHHPIMMCGDRSSKNGASSVSTLHSAVASMLRKAHLTNSNVSAS